MRALAHVSVEGIVGAAHVVAKGVSTKHYVVC